MNKKRILAPLILIAFFICFVTPVIKADVSNEIEPYLKNRLGKDFFSNYVKEPIINPVIDPKWAGYDKEKAKKILQTENLAPVKNIVIYPIEIDGVKSSFRVIVFEDNKFYSELTQSIKININKNRAIELAKERGIEEPFNILLTMTDNFFGWNMISTKNPNQIKEGEVTQVSIELSTGEVNSNVFNPIRYNEDSKGGNKINIIWIVLILILLAGPIFWLIIKLRGKKNEKIE